jgi:AcrR family transcriptional regulator
VQRSDDERDRILAAAWVVLQKAGYDGFKVQSVLREADVSARTFYREFADKDGLFIALLEEEMARAAPRIRAAVERVDGPAERVEAWIRSVLSAAEDPRRSARTRLFGTLQAVSRRFPQRIAPGAQALAEPLMEAIAAGRQSGLFAWAVPERDARMVYELTGGLLSSEALADPPPRPLEAVIRDATEFSLRALGVPPDSDRPRLG